MKSELVGSGVNTSTVLLDIATFSSVGHTTSVLAVLQESAVSQALVLGFCQSER